MTMGCDSDLPLLAARSLTRSLAVTSRRSDFCKLRHVNGGRAAARQDGRAARAAGAVVQSAAVHIWCASLLCGHSSQMMHAESGGEREGEGREMQSPLSPLSLLALTATRLVETPTAHERASQNAEMLNVPLSALLRLHSRHSVTRQIIRGSQNRTRMFACSADRYRIRQTLWLTGCRWNVVHRRIGASAFLYPFHLQSRNPGKNFGVTL